MIKRYSIKSFMTTTQTFLYSKTSYFTFHIPIRDFDVVRYILIHRCRHHQILTSHQKDESSPLRSPLCSPQIFFANFVVSIFVQIITCEMTKRYSIRSFMTTTQTFLHSKTSYSTFHIFIRDSDVVRYILIHRCRRHQILTSH